MYRDVSGPLDMNGATQMASNADGQPSIKHRMCHLSILECSFELAWRTVEDGGKRVSSLPFYDHLKRCAVQANEARTRESSLSYLTTITLRDPKQVD